jgi:2-polyprenyl-3-methyl-5-hydroxy-6-metoxy-1,4-benzoquinol methylase
MGIMIESVVYAKEGSRKVNITDPSFWDAKYRRTIPRYSLYDPLYGKRGLLAKTLLPWFKDKKNILEIGCGSSRFMMLFRLVAGLDTYGIDFSIEGIQALRAMAGRYAISHQIYFGDMLLHDLEGLKFDVVFHSGMVEHFSNLKVFFERCRFFCKDNGLMVFLMPNMQNMAWKWHRRLCPKNFKAHIPYTKEDIIRGISPQFKLIRVGPWGYPQLYAGGPPESIYGLILKYLNMALIAWISCIMPGYRGIVPQSLASAWLFVCKPE